jgi:hypothetical protein
MKLNSARMEIGGEKRKALSLAEAQSPQRENK